MLRKVARHETGNDTTAIATIAARDTIDTNVAIPQGPENEDPGEENTSPDTAMSMAIIDISGRAIRRITAMTAAIPINVDTGTRAKETNQQKHRPL